MTIHTITTTAIGVGETGPRDAPPTGPKEHQSNFLSLYL